MTVLDELAERMTQDFFSVLAQEVREFAGQRFRPPESPPPPRARAEVLFGKYLKLAYDQGVIDGLAKAEDIIRPKKGAP